MTVKSHTREVGPMSTRADIVPGSLNEEARTVDVVWTTGARVKRYSWFDGPWYEELSTDPKHVRMGRLQSGRAPVLLQHNSYDPDAHQGVVTSARLEGGKGIATLRFLKDDPDADKSWNKIRQGVLSSVSVGYTVHRLEKIEETADGPPVMRATDWEPYEISPVSMPADPDAHMRSAPAVRTNPCEVITRGEAPHEEKTMPEEKKDTAPAQTDAARQAELKAVEDKAREEEKTRTATITTLVRKAGLGDDLAKRLIDENASVETARAVLLDKLTERSDAVVTSSHVRIEAGADQRDKFLRGAEAWLLQRAGKGALVETAAKAGKVKPAATDPGEFRGLNLIALARESLERSGVNTRMWSDERIAEIALLKRAPGMATESDFPVLLENVTNKILLSSFAVTPHEWSRFCSRGSVANFHAHNRYRKGAFGTLDAVNDHGELKTKAIPDGEKREVTVGTYGNKIGISRRTLIQDDMGVFTDLASSFGMAAQNTIEGLVWTTLKANSGLGANYDANPLFHASRANIGTTSALSAAGLDADATIMARQADPSGTTTLALNPAILILPRELRSSAMILNNDAYDPDSGTKQNRTNPVRSMFSDIVASTRLTGTRRYLFADPNVAPVIEVTFLQGQEAPQMESQEGFEVLGLQWRIFMDFGVSLVDYRGAVTNAGS
jgi:HK97 family phage prohead protease